MRSVLSVNVGASMVTRHSDLGVTGIDKRPAPGPVLLRDPGPRGSGGSGVVGDVVSDLRHHGGYDQAVYAYAREDLDRWEADLGRELGCGVFGENLTTVGIDPAAALIGERWQIGESVLEVSTPRIPCRTFAGWLAQSGWVEQFTEREASGAYLRVVRPGMVTAGDPIVVTHRPEHEVTIGLAFRALTTQRDLLPLLLTAGDALTPSDRAAALRQQERIDKRSPSGDPAPS